MIEVSGRCLSGARTNNRQGRAFSLGILAAINRPSLRIRKYIVVISFDWPSESPGPTGDRSDFQQGQRFDRTRPISSSSELLHPNVE